MITQAVEPGPLAVGLAECKAALRLERDDEDALIAGHIRASMALCEAFIGQWLIEREGEQRLMADLVWQRLQAEPVQLISAVIIGGASATDGWEQAVDADGTGWVRLIRLPTMPAVVRFRAGIGLDWNSVPEPLRAGIVRLVSHMYTHRDAAESGPPPAAVTAMWRPWRRLRIG
jgi:uncharacterized phiE125 gp8 family phage protein